MKIKKQDLKQMIEGMLEYLQPAFTQVHSKKFGYSLIESGVLKDAKGRDINPKLMYSTIEQGQPVNHERAMKKIIADAKDTKDMQEKMANYLLKYGKPEVTQIK